MVTPEQIEQLRSFESPKFPVVSLYLDTDPTRVEKRGYIIAAKNILKELERKLDDRAKRKAFQDDVASILYFLESETNPSARGVAIFSCKAQGLWQVYRLPVSVPNKGHVGPTPYIQTLLDVLDEYERYAVVLLDKEKVKLFTVYLGEIEERQLEADMMPKKHKQGGWSEVGYQRAKPGVNRPQGAGGMGSFGHDVQAHHEAHVQWHIKHIIELLSEELNHHSFDRIIVAGTEEALAEFNRLLPGDLKERVVGSFSAEMFASPADILRETMAIEERVEREKELQIVNSLVEATLKGSNGVLGLDDTLMALQEGRIYTLVVNFDLTAQGRRCLGCGYLTAILADKCPVCGADMEQVENVVDLAVQTARDRGAQVEFVRGAAAEVLRGYGGIGGVLRF
jgi:peptide chain release factor subunit 1